MQGITIAVIFSLMLGEFAYARQDQQSSIDTGTVIFTTSQSSARFTIACHLKSDAAGIDDGWVNECNRLGNDALVKAADDGLVARHQGQAFGMSSELAKSGPEDARHDVKVISRDFSIIGLAL